MFRGFDVAGLGPREITIVTDQNNAVVDTIYGDALGGNLFAIGTLQVTFPLGLPESFGLSGAVFAEFGTLGLLDEGSRGSTQFTIPGIIPGEYQVYTTYVEHAATLRASAGVSIFWDSPFGPVQFDFSHPFAREDFDRTESFRFSTRTRF